MSPSHSSTRNIWVVIVCFLVLSAEGFDLAMFGSILPSLRADPALGITPEMAGYLGSAGVFGMLMGSALAAAFADRYGRRTVTIAAVALFSIGMLVSAWATSAEQLLALRLVVGAGAGAVMPTCAATLLEYAPKRRRALWMAMGFSGVGVGGVIAGMVSLFLIENHGWRSMFVVAAVSLAFIPLIQWRFPESVSFLLANGREAAALNLARHHGMDLKEQRTDENDMPTTTPLGRDEYKSGKGRLAEVLGGGRALGSILFWLATAVCLLVNFGVAAWLPDLMNSAGYPVAVALGSMVALKTGAVIGTLVGGWLADVFGQKRVVLCTYVLTAASLLLLATRPTPTVAYLLIGCLGMGTTGLQTLINAYVGSYYPAKVRATALGLNLSIGRIGGIVGPMYLGFLVAGGINFSGRFYALAIPAIIGAVIIALVPTRATRKSSPPLAGRVTPDPVEAGPGSNGARSGY